jgi:hypothetical protein
MTSKFHLISDISACKTFNVLDLTSTQVLKLFFFFFVGLGLELRASHLQSRHSTT